MTGTVELMYVRTSFSRHFIAAEVSATGLRLLIVVAVFFFGTGTISDDLKVRGTVS